MARMFILLGAIAMVLAVSLGAFAAHLLIQKLSPDMFSIYEVGVRYHVYHALGLFLVGLLIAQFPDMNYQVAGWLFLAGIVIFSGSLYALSITGTRWLGAITPIGGLAFLAGWGWIAWQAWKSI